MKISIESMSNFWKILKDIFIFLIKINIIKNYLLPTTATTKIQGLFYQILSDSL